MMMGTSRNLHAIDCVVSQMTIDGLTSDEAIELLLSPDYRAKTFELLETAKFWWR